MLAGTLDGDVEKGVQSEHVIGDIKHYALNDQESGRNAVNVNIDKRAMRETRPAGVSDCARDIGRGRR